MIGGDNSSTATVLNACPFGVLTVADGIVRECNAAARDTLDIDSPDGEPVEAVFPDAVDRPITEVFADGDPTQSIEFDEYYPDLDQWLSVTVEPVPVGAAVYVKDISDRVAGERQVERLTGRLDRVAAISELLSTVLSQLIDASTREELAERICTRLGDVNRYAFAWFGERDPATDTMEIRATGGEAGETFASVRDNLESSPERQAMDTGRAEVIESVANDERVPPEVRRAAFADGIQSLIAVPLVHGETVYGVVGVYATQRDAFSERARESFETLGAVGGFAVDAIRNRDLLSANEVTAYTFEVTEPDAPLVSAATTTGAVLTVDGTVPPHDNHLTCYLHVDGESPNKTASTLRSESAVGAVRTLTDDGTAGRLEVELAAETPLHTAVSFGASIADARFTPDQGRVTAELPQGPEYDVRRLAETLGRRFDIDTVSTIRQERAPVTGQQLRTELSDRLTDRQTDVLRTAYLAGYFQSPRDSTAEEVGAALGITGSTLLHHLRAGQRKLLDVYFDVDSRADPTVGVNSMNQGNGNPDN